MKFKQWCDICKDRVEVETDNIAVVACPNCGKPLMPCPVCHGQLNDDFGCRRGCTLRINYFNKMKNFEKANNL